MENIFQNVLKLLTVEEKGFISGKILKEMFLRSYDILQENFEIINRINVYPVADGDTGINMFETLRAIRHELETIDNSASCAEIIERVSSGAFNGCAGNSGIILSEYIHGMEIAWKDLVNISGQKLKSGLKKAMECSYLSIDEPAEGTMLTIQKDISEFANELEAVYDNPFFVIFSIFTKAKQSLLDTHFTLADINKANTIDSGALGFVLILEGFVSAVFDDEIFSLYTSRTICTDIIPFLEINYENLSITEQEWEVQFTIFSIRKTIDNIKKQLRNEGKCLIITSENEHPDYKIHIHTKEPVNEFLEKMKLVFGEISNIKVMDLREQNKDYRKTLLHNKVT